MPYTHRQFTLPAGGGFEPTVPAELAAEAAEGGVQTTV